MIRVAQRPKAFGLWTLFCFYLVLIPQLHRGRYVQKAHKAFGPCAFFIYILSRGRTAKMKRSDKHVPKRTRQAETGHPGSAAYVHGAVQVTEHTDEKGTKNHG